MFLLFEISLLYWIVLLSLYKFKIIIIKKKIFNKLYKMNLWIIQVGISKIIYVSKNIREGNLLQY